MVHIALLVFYFRVILRCDHIGRPLFSLSVPPGDFFTPLEKEEINLRSSACQFGQLIRVALRQCVE